MGKRKIIVTIGEKEEEFDVECEESVVIDDCSFKFKKKKVVKNTLYLTGNKLGKKLDSLDGNYTERKLVDINVKLVALMYGHQTFVAYVKTDGILYLNDGILIHQLALNVTQIKFQDRKLYYISDNTLYKYIIFTGTCIMIHTKVSMFSCGDDIVIFIYEGELFGFGEGDNGILCDYDISNHTVEQPICIARNVRYVSVGCDHTVFITNDNLMFGFGNGEYGRLGDKNITDHCVLGPIFIKDNVVKVFAGKWNTMFIRTDNVLYGLGDAQYGKMNDKRSVCHDYLSKKYIFPNVVDVKSEKFSSDYTMFKFDTGDLYFIGSLCYNQYINDTTDSVGVYKTYINKQLINKPGEKIGDFDCNRANIAYIVK